MSNSPCYSLSSSKVSAKTRAEHSFFSLDREKDFVHNPSPSYPQGYPQASGISAPNSFFWSSLDLFVTHKNLSLGFALNLGAKPSESYEFFAIWYKSQRKAQRTAVLGKITTFRSEETFGVRLPKSWRCNSRNGHISEILKTLLRNLWFLMETVNGLFTMWKNSGKKFDGQKRHAYNA